MLSGTPYGSAAEVLEYEFIDQNKVRRTWGGATEAEACSHDFSGCFRYIRGSIYHGYRA
jgi:hypothetical protein